MKQTSSLSEYNLPSEFTRLYPSYYIEILSEASLDILIYMEQIAKVLIRLCGYTG